MVPQNSKNVLINKHNFVVGSKLAATNDKTIHTKFVAISFIFSSK